MLALTASQAARGHAPLLTGLSAVVPVHDEEAAVADVVTALARELPTVAQAVELIVVDDGSRDATPEVLRRLTRTIPALRVVHHASNRGYGAALRSGFAAARYPYVFLMDGDGQFEPAQLGDALTALDGHDGVIGYRAARADGLGRRMNTAAWNTLVRALFGLHVRDVNCAFKLLPRALVQGDVLTSGGAVISTEILVRAARAGYRLAEVPARHHPRRSGRASGARPRVVARALLELVALYRHRRAGARG